MEIVETPHKELMEQELFHDLFNSPEEELFGTQVQNIITETKIVFDNIFIYKVAVQKLDYVRNIIVSKFNQDFEFVCDASLVYILDKEFTKNIDIYTGDEHIYVSFDESIFKFDKDNCHFITKMN